jgi:hypothetical protein
LLIFLAVTSASATFCSRSFHRIRRDFVAAFSRKKRGRFDSARERHGAQISLKNLRFLTQLSHSHFEWDAERSFSDLIGVMVLVCFDR